MKNVAVVGCTVTLSPGTGAAQITTQASLKVKADRKGIYFGPIDVSIKDSFSDNEKKLVDFVMDTANNFTLTTYDNGSAKNTIKMASDGVTINNNLSIANT